jgi:glutathione S-transferase
VDDADAIISHCRRLADDEVERLVGWLAWRLGRNQALAGAGPPIARLRHVVTHWLDPARRARLLAWLRHRHRAGLPAVPA